jgi:hypothetical protein
VSDWSFPPSRASIIQQEITKVGKVNEESVYKPVLIRGADGKSQIFSNLLPVRL